MSTIITDELNIHKLDEKQIYDNKINNLISEMVNTKDNNTKLKLRYQIKQTRREKSYYLFKNYLKKFLANIFILGLFTLNLVSVAVSMSCSRKMGLIKRIFSALYAFFFSILYIFINYRYYRLTIKKDTTSCNICPNNPFAL